MAKASKSKTKVSGKGAVSNGKGGGDIDRLEKILHLMESHDVAELEWERSGERIRLRTKASFVASGSVEYLPAPRAVPALTHAPAQLPEPVKPQAAAPAAAAKAEPAGKQVASPFVGTFYRSSSPTAEPYVREGQMVKRGDVLCIIEAMKLMNEIEAEFPGKILSVLVENGQPVEFGEPLFIIEP